MPPVVTLALVHLVASHDALVALERTTSVGPLVGRRRTADYAALARQVARHAQPLLPATLDPTRVELVAAARTHAAALAASLTATVRRTLTVCRDVVDVGDAGVEVSTPCDDPRCPGCLALRAELDVVADEHRDAWVAALEARLDAWPTTPPSLPWQLDHEPAAEAA